MNRPRRRGTVPIGFQEKAGRLLGVAIGEAEFELIDGPGSFHVQNRCGMAWLNGSGAGCWGEAVFRYRAIPGLLPPRCHLVDRDLGVELRYGGSGGELVGKDVVEMGLAHLVGRDHAPLLIRDGNITPRGSVIGFLIPDKRPGEGSCFATVDLQKRDAQCRFFVAVEANDEVTVVTDGTDYVNAAGAFFIKKYPLVILLVQIRESGCKSVVIAAKHVVTVGAYGVGCVIARMAMSMVRLALPVR